MNQTSVGAFADDDRELVSGTYRGHGYVCQWYPGDSRAAVYVIDGEGAEPLAWAPAAPRDTSWHDIVCARLPDGSWEIRVDGDPLALSTNTVDTRYRRLTHVTTFVDPDSTLRGIDEIEIVDCGAGSCGDGTCSHDESLATCREDCAGTPRWTKVGALTVRRSNHDAVKLIDGDAVVVGGHDGSSAVTQAERYDPVERTWSSAGHLKQGRFIAAATVLESGDALAIGGDIGGATFTASVESYDPGANSWGGVAGMDEVRGNITATRLGDGKIIVPGGMYRLGGAYVYGSRAKCEIFDPSAGTWALAGSLIEDRHGHASVLLPDGRLFVAGGEYHHAGTHGVRDSAEVYDPIDDEWSSAGTMSYKRTYFAAALLPDGRVLVTGGMYHNAPGSSWYYLNDAEIYDPTDNSWESASPMSVPRRHHTLTAMPNGEILAAGGWTDGSVYDSAELYDPYADEWRPAGTMIQARAYHTATLLDTGEVLMAGGSDGSTSLASAELLSFE